MLPSERYFTDVPRRAFAYYLLRQAHDGDHTPLIQCLLDGMRATLESIQAAFKTL